MNFQASIYEIWDRFLTPIDDPSSRLFHTHIWASLLLILVWILLTQRTLSPQKLASALRQLVFRKSYWWNTSTKVDYKVYILNALLKVFLFIPLFEMSYLFSKFTVKTLLNWQGDFISLEPTFTAMLGFTALAFVWDDFLRFFHHWLMHKIPMLWSYHKLHHSARVLTPLTLFRTHPLESAMATVRNSLSLGVLIGLFIFLFESQFSVLTLFGVNLFGGLFNFLGANLRHSHIPLSFGILDHLIISPRQHQLHHSNRPEHFDCNFGVSLAVWDHLFGSFKRPTDSRRLKFGLTEVHRTSLAFHLRQPILENFYAFKRQLQLLKAYCKQAELQLLPLKASCRLAFSFVDFFRNALPFKARSRMSGVLKKHLKGDIHG